MHTVIASLIRSGRRARERRGRLILFAVLVTIAAALAMPVAEAAPPMPAGRVVHPGGRHSVAAEQAQTLASDQARRTGRPVIVAALTTPDSITQALPDGRFKLTTSNGPVRAWTSRGWQPLNPALQRGSGGTWSPAVSVSPVSVSGGGSGPLAVLTSQGRTAAVYWPGRLPRPVIAGDTAVYRSVLPGTDLRVTVTAQGGFRYVLVIGSREAAANPALGHLALTVVTGEGLRLVTGPGGSLQAAPGSGSVPAFTSPAALLWDSATTAAAPIRGSALAKRQPLTGLPGSPQLSTARRPGARAHAAWVFGTVSAPRTWSGMTWQTVDLALGRALLSSGAAVYPVYASSGWLPSGGSAAWYVSDAQAFPDNNFYNYPYTADPSPTYYRQVGWSSQTGITHTFVQMYLHSGQLNDAVINDATLQFTLMHTGSCSNTPPVQLWFAGEAPVVNGQRTINWPHEPAWIHWNDSHALSSGAITQASASACSGSVNVDFNIKYFMQYWGPNGPTTATFGLQSTDTSDINGWMEFASDPGSITMTTWYAHAPAAQQGTYTSPGGDCQNISPSRTMIGNDDVTLNTTPYDQDPGSLTTEFVLLPYNAPAGTKPLVDTTVTTTSGVNFPLTILRSTIQETWPNSGNGQYEWYTITTDQAGLSNAGDTGIGSQTRPCLFTYDTSAPSAPGVHPPTLPGTIAGTAQFTFAQCTLILDTPPGTCTGTPPARYVYQVNDEPPVTVKVTGTTQSVSIRLTIPLARVGANTISVVGISAAGNPSPATPASFTVNPPTPAYPDGDYAGTGQPDLITVGDGTGSATEPGLWMSQSDGAGHLGTPVDIGIQGTGQNTYGTPADWAGMQILHGDFTGNHVQDIVTYDPASGNLRMIGGPGAPAPLAPKLDNSVGIGSQLRAGSTCVPTNVVAAGNASLLSKGLPDLIGILPSSDSTPCAPASYSLDLYTATKNAAFSNGYDNAQVDAANPSPPPQSTDKTWGPGWTLAVAQPGGTPVLLALDTNTGQLFESTGTATTSGDTSHLVGMAQSTWTPVTGGPWTGNSHTDPQLVQADVNSDNQIELWTVSGATATSWVLSPPASGASNATLAVEVTNPLPVPGHAWPLTDGPAETPTSSGTVSLIDTQSANGSATGSGLDFTGDHNSHELDPILGPAAIFDSATPSLTLPAGILQDNNTSGHTALQSMTLTLRFMATPGAYGILAGTSTGNLSDTTLSNSSAPIIYIGTDGRLYAQFPSGHVNPSTGVIAPDITPLMSPGPVTDGQWHTVTLVADNTSHDQILYLDNNIPVHLVNNGYINPANNGLPNPAQPPVIINPGQTSTSQTYGLNQVTIGAGIFSTAGWVNADRAHGADGTTHPSYFTAPGNGTTAAESSDIAFYPRALTPAQLPHNTPTAVTSTITSGNYPGPCIDNSGSTIANSNPIDIYTCNGTGAQNWTIEPDGTIRLAANTGYCLDVTGGGTSNGTLLDLYTCIKGDDSQQWQMLSDGEILNTGSGKCINDTGGSTTNGTQLQIYNCNGDQNSTWASAPVPAETPVSATIVSVLSGLCVLNSGATSSTDPGNTGNFNPVQVGTCNGWAAQQWTFQPDGTIHIAGKCLDNSSAGTTNGNPEDIYTCNGSGAQEWAHLDTGAFYNVLAGKCLDGRANTTGIQIAIWDCNDTADQAWIAPDTYNRG